MTPPQWQHLAGTLLTDYFNGGVAVSQAILAADHQISHAAWVRVAVVSGVGLLGLLAHHHRHHRCVARSIIRRLGGLERNALQLAEVQLPDVVGRLRRGENVDVNAEAPPLRVGRDEIGRVGQAFDLVRQTAIRAAVEEARLRQGLNDVFRSLARRSQSLLHRQLTLLDQMERRASDPEALDDLFRLDHLTTRMRRHAEGLVILAGAPPGRGWSSPVRMVDVMRGAIAEVEDYARVSVATRSQAALTGSAVADVIHLLAELIENATTLSPPYTSVRVSGDTVANGFAIEVEDRGLGIEPDAAGRAERPAGQPAGVQPVRQRAARPVRGQPAGQAARDPGDAEGLTLRRHGRHRADTAAPGGDRGGVQVRAARRARRGSAHRQRQPRRHLGPGRPRSPAELAGQDSGSGFSELGGMPGLGRAPGVRISGPLRRSQGIVPERPERGGTARARPRSARRTARRATGRMTCPGGIMTSRETARPGGERRRDAVRRPAVLLRRVHAAAGSGPGDPARPAPGPARHPRATGLTRRRRIRRPARRRSRERPRRLPSPAAAAPYPDQPAPFPGWTLHSTPDAPAARAGPGSGRAGHPDDPGGLAAPGAGLRAAVGDLPRDRAASRGAGSGRTRGT